MLLPENILSLKSFLIEKGIPTCIDAAVILGSGLGDFGGTIQNSITIPYALIPGFPQSTVAGHTGSLIFGDMNGKKTMAFSGRFHHYEGHDFSKTILPVQLAKAFEVEKLIISNAAGGINLDFHVGDLMIIEGIIRQNMMVTTPSSSVWNYNLSKYIFDVETIATNLNINIKKGVYLYVKGPNYETKAEINAFRKLGGDAVGMSTAPELSEAARLGIKTTAISLITNAAAGVTEQKLNHDEVKETAGLKKDEFAKLVKGLIEKL